MFTGCLLLFLASMTLVTVSQHFGLLWVGIEATTLASAPLIYFHRQHRSLEATWKYLLICSVGIALALLGNILLAVAAAGHRSITSSSLVLSELLVGQNGPRLLAQGGVLVLPGRLRHEDGPGADAHLAARRPQRIAFARVGAPFRRPVELRVSGHSAGPSGLRRGRRSPFSQGLLLFFGLLSMGVAAIFIIAQADYKRMLAYSSVEHMGILAIGVGLGGAGALGGSLHAVNHSFTKAMLFLVAGNILATFGTKSIRDVRGVLESHSLVRRAVAGRLPGHHRHAAVRALPQRVHHSQGGARSRSGLGRRHLSAVSGDHLRRHGQ